MKSDTRSSLIEVATGQVRRQGYSGFSYADLASVAGIRKPSIHHHFPTKEDLGVELVALYSERISQELDRIESETEDPIERLRGFAGLYRQALDEKQGCLCGVLAAEMAALPPRVQAGVRQFFRVNLRWLERTLGSGCTSGRLRIGVEPRRDARTVLATLQGALLVALSVQQPASFDQAVEGLLRGLSTDGA
jgi:TetR/AcrR family transcriptional repressor of nem operon